MGTTTRAILLNISAFFADNNIRRNIATFVENYITSGSAANVTYQTVPAGSNYTFTPPTTPTSVVLLNVSAPLFATVNVAAVTLNSVVRNAAAIQLAVNAQLVLDDSITQVVLQNPNSFDVQVSIIQG